MANVTMYYQVLRVRHLDGYRWQVIGVSNKQSAFPDRRNSVIVSSPRSISTASICDLAEQHWQDTRKGGQ